MSRRLSLWILALPLFLETALNLALYVTDTLFLSQVSDLAAGAVGALVPVLGVVIFGYQAFSQSAASVAAQFESGGDSATAILGCRILLITALLVGLIFSIVFYFIAPFAGGLIGLSSLASVHTFEYLNLLGPFLFLQFLRLSYGTILSFRGMPGWPMIASALTLMLNVGLNALFLNSGLLPTLSSVECVALATVISQFVGLIIVAIRCHSIPGMSIRAHEDSRERFLATARSIFAVALPSTVEPVSTEFLFVVQIMIIAQFGDRAVIAHSYAFNITLLVVVFATSLAIASQIVVSHLLGQREFEVAMNVVKRYFQLVAMIGFLVGLGIYVFREPILGALTEAREIVVLCEHLLLVSLALQVGVAANLVFGMALRTTTDSRYSAGMGLLVMWLFGLPMMFFCGVVAQGGVVGVWIGKMLDELLRGFLHARRWEKGVWIRRATKLYDGRPATTETVSQNRELGG